MLQKIKTKVVQRVENALTRKQRGVALTVGSMGALMAGRKISSLTMLYKGMKDIEAEWRLAHPEFEGGLKARWDEAISFYESTHQDDTNRKLHIIGIPIIVGSTVGLFVFPSYSPPWILAAAGFAGGWALNIAGHVFFEKNAPAFTDDPLSFVAGPIWDLKNIRSVFMGSAEAPAAA